MLHRLGSGTPNLPGHMLLTGRAEGDKWALSDGEVLGGARSVEAGARPPSLQAPLVRNLERPIATKPPALIFRSLLSQRYSWARPWLPG